MKLAVAAACAVVLSFGALPAHAQVDADKKEIQTYRLTMESLNQFAAVTRNMVTAMKADPRFGQVMKLRAEQERLQTKDELTEAEEQRIEKLDEEIDALESALPDLAMNASEAKTLSEMEAALRKEPIMAKALGSAGMSPRDYAKFTLAFFQAAMVHGMQKAGHLKEIPKDLQASINMENLAFMETHQAEIAKVMADLQALSGQ